MREGELKSVLTRNPRERTRKSYCVRGRPIKFRKIAAWEDRNIKPTGDKVVLLEAVDAPPDHLCYTRLSWSVLTDEEFDALERGEVSALKYLDERVDRF